MAPTSARTSTSEQRSGMVFLLIWLRFGGTRTRHVD
jgi:hypothetical protein